MLTREEYMDLLAMKRQGMTLKEMAERLGYHPQTVSGWLRRGGPPAKRSASHDVGVLDERWRRRLEELVRANGRLLATSLFDILAAEGFEGSYPTVVRHVRSLRGPRFRAADAASVPIETGPGEEAQFDWSDCTDWAERWGWDGELWCFGAILCWSRARIWWFAASIDREHTFEGLVRFFEAMGGLPAAARTDRMGALGRSQGRRFSLHAPALEFARHHGIELASCAAGDAKRKGKVERPFRVLKESFLEELEVTGVPRDLDELNERGAAWVERRVHEVAHRSTGVAPAERLATERSFLRPLPRRRFDTAYVEPRRVHVAVPLVEWDGVRYSVPADCRGQLVEVRREVDADVVVVRWAGTVVAEHRLAPTGTTEVWDPAHRASAEAAALARHGRRHLRAVPAIEEVAGPVGTLELGEGDYDVPEVDLARYGSHGPHPDALGLVDIASTGRTAGPFSGCECLGGGW